MLRFYQRAQERSPTGPCRAAFSRCAGRGAQGLERNDPPLFCRHPGVVDPGAGGPFLEGTASRRAAAEAAVVPPGAGVGPGRVRHVDGDPQALATGRDRPSAGRLRHLEPAVPADSAPVRCAARAGGATPPATLGDGRVAAGDPADRPRGVGQFQLCRRGLHRPADLPRPMVAGGGFRQRFPPDPAHRPQLPSSTATHARRFI